MSAAPGTVAVIGARGRMGRFACELLRAGGEFRVVAEIGRGDSIAAVLRESGATLALDLTVAGRGGEHARAILAAGVRPVVGTSGVSAEETRELDRVARAEGLGGIVVPNFSLGMAWLNRAAERLARVFPDVSIVEYHHERKRDAPSSSARATAERLARARAGTPVPIQSVRLPGLYAHQEVLFGAPGETLTLRHDMLGPEAFGPGLLASLRHAARAQGVGFGLEIALEELGEPHKF